MVSARLRLSEQAEVIAATTAEAPQHKCHTTVKGLSKA